MESNENDIVISGMSGRFPDSNNIKEFMQNLYSKVDMVDDDESRWKHFRDDVPRRFGKVRNLEKFDASFFSTLNKHANWTDPQMRILLEHSYESILDAGISPQSLVGSKTGVFIGCCLSDAKDYFLHGVPPKEGYVVLGNAPFYLANRISYALGLCGPSFVVDTACSSSAYALDCAYRYMEAGLCDQALVGGSSIILKCGLAAEYTTLGIISNDGYCKPFDEGASGFTRAEAVCMIFLQKRKDSKRIYASLIYSSSNNDGFKKEGSSFPSRFQQQKLIDDFYKTIDFDPKNVNYVEAHATGTKLGDPEEVAAIDAGFCKTNRDRQLVIGSVKSNMGHAEAASGMASIAKILLSFETRKFPPNINIDAARLDIPAFAEGRIKVATEPVDLEGDYIAMNSFGLGGANAHSLYRGNAKNKVNSGIPKDSLERIVLWAGRTEEAINAIFEDITTRPLDAEYIALLQNSQVQTTHANTYRGYGIFAHDDAERKAVCRQKNVQYYNGTRRPVVFVYSGVGSQWIQMGKDLMNVPLFAESIEKCHNVLLPKGIDLKKVIATSDKDIFKDILHTFVGVISIEIALTNVLKALGIVPDFIIGHSVGELGCAYADNCLTLEETILAAHARGESNQQSNTILGGMAAIGMHHMNLKNILPSDIDIACHNAEDSTTISGPIVSVNQFVAKLKADGIFAREVACSGVPFHSRYIAKNGQKISEKLTELIKNPKRRSEKWLSSTFSKEQWNKEEAIFSSAEYHTKNLLNPVHFLEVSKMLPKDSLIIEIAPHGLLKPILKRNLSESVYTSLTQRNSKDGIEFLMNSLGSIFQYGVDMDISKLYPAVEFPVSRGTPMISPVIKWNHKENHFVPYFDSYNTYERRNIVINVNDKNFEYIQGHVIDNRILFPATGWVFLAWETFSMMLCEHYENVKVVIEDIHFLRATTLSKNQDVAITISIHRGSGKFEIVEGNSPVVHGYIKRADNVQLTDLSDLQFDDVFKLDEDDFYKIMRVIGFCHHGVFRTMKEIAADGMRGKLKWYNWITFLDGVTQCEKRSEKFKRLGIPTNIRKIVIDPITQKRMIQEKIKEFESLPVDQRPENPEILFDVVVSEFQNVVQSGGVEMHEKRKQIVNRRTPKEPQFEAQLFVPFFANQKYSLIDAVKILVQTAQENTMQLKCSAVELETSDSGETLKVSECIVQALRAMPQIVPDVTYISSRDNLNLDGVITSSEELSSFKELDLVVGRNCLADKEFLEMSRGALNAQGYIISIEQSLGTAVPDSVQVVSKVPLENDVCLYLIQFKLDQKIFDQSNIIEITSNTEHWLEPLKKSLKEASTLIYGYNKEPSGILGLLNCMRKEYSVDKLTCFFIVDTEGAPDTFNLNNPFFKKQLDLNHAVNVFKDGEWGSYKYFDIPANINIFEPQSKHYYVDGLVKGDLSQLAWVNGPLDVNDTSKDIIRIKYASLNFKDVMLALGRIPDSRDLPISNQYILGFEFSGVNPNGQRVMGIGNNAGALATHYELKDTTTWIVPDSWSMAEAATVPLVYFTVYFAFFRACTIKAGKKILIHSGCGGVGQAAIRVALAYGLEVFTTVGTDEKKEFLLKTFPSLKPENIGNSRDLSFEKMVMKNTKLKGVDYVLNSLSEEKLHASIRCLGIDGIFLEIGKYDIVKGTNLNMNILEKRISVKAINFDDHRFRTDEIVEDLKKVYEHVSKDIELGIIKPLNTTIFEACEVEEAFRFMANGKHIGKVLLKIRENENDISSLPLKVVDRVHFNPEETVIVTGAFGGFSMELLDWIVSRGCRKLVLGTRRGIVTGFHKFKVMLLDLWQVKYVVSTADTTTESGCEQLFKEALELGSVGAIFNLAGVLRDGIFENLDHKMFVESMAPKASSTINLDKFSRKLCPDLKHFVVFSSVSCGRGNAGQSNYGMANSVMERIIEARRRDDLPGKAIQWGAIGDVGMLAEFQLTNMDIDVGGTLPQPIASCLESMDVLLTADASIVSSMILAEKQVKDFRKGNVIDIILNIMGVRDKKSISMDSTLTQLGIDSLMGVEIQQILEREFDVSFTSQELRSLTLNQLEKRISSKGSISEKDTKQADDIDELEWMRILNEGVFDTEKMQLVTTETLVKANEKDSCENTKVLIVPGFYGYAATSFHKIAKVMSYPAYILQLLGTIDCKSMNEIVEKLTPDILDLFADVDNFILIGHSFGAALSHQFAKILEAHDKSGRIILVDGSPEFVNRLASKMMSERTEQGLKETVSSVLFNMFAPLAKPNIAQAAFEKHDNWTARTKSLVEMSKEFPFDYELLKNLFVMSFVNRCYISEKIQIEDFCALKSSTISLVKSTVPAVVGLSADYGLSQYACGDVKVKSVDGDHVTILLNPDLAESIRKLLDD